MNNSFRKSFVILVFGLIVAANQLIAAQKSDGADWVNRFYSYLEADFNYSFETFSSDEREKWRNQRDEILALLESGGEEVGTALISEYDRLGGGAERRSQLMNFSRQTGLGKQGFLNRARDVILSTDLTAPRNPMLSVSLEFLGEHGDASDLELFERISEHTNPAYVRICNENLARLKLALSYPNRSDTKNTDDSLAGSKAEERSGPDQPIKVGPDSESISQPVWPLLLGTIAVLGIVVLLRKWQKGSCDKS